MRYMYSFSLHNQEGYRQTVDASDRVIDVRSISLREAQEKYSLFPNGEKVT